MTAPGSYCMARCYCGEHPQYAAQHAANDLLREQEYAARTRKHGAREAQKQRRGKRPAGLGSES